MPSIPEIVQQKFLPWSREHDEQRLVLIRSRQQDLQLPVSVRATPYRLRGKRLAAVGPRFHRDRVTTAHWPDDNLTAKKVAIIVGVADGCADLCFGEYSLRVPAGHLILIPPDMPHPMGRGIPHLDAEAQARREFCDLLWFSRWGHSIRCWVCHSHSQKHVHNFREHFFVLSSHALSVFNLLSEEMQENAPDSPAICADMLSAFFAILAREFQRDEFIHPGFSTADANEEWGEELLEDGDPIEQIQHYVKSHLRENLTIETAARKVYMSRSLFTLRFRQQTGQSFRQYVTTCRLEEAKLLLQNSQLAISLIPTYIGLSPSCFFELFQKDTGHSPSEFRAIARSSSENKRQP